MSFPPREWRFLPLVVFPAFRAAAGFHLVNRSTRTGRPSSKRIGDALPAVIEWVPWIGPLGVLALALVVGSRGGRGRLWWAWPLHRADFGGWILSRSPLIRSAIFAAARLGAAQLTRRRSRAAWRSPRAHRSCPCLRRLLLPEPWQPRRGRRCHPADRARSVPSHRPGMIRRAFLCRHRLGLHPSISQMIAATAVGAATSYGAVSLPGRGQRHQLHRADRPRAWGSDRPARLARRC